MRRFILLFVLLAGLQFTACFSQASDLAIVDAKVYASPSAPPISNATVLVRDGRIAAVGPSAKIKIPQGAEMLDGKGLIVTAGFWNSHVHMLPPGLLHAENLPNAQISAQLEQMLTRWGFTTVFDIASLLDNTNNIRRRIADGSVRGPRILTVGEPLYSKTPVYVLDFFEANHISIPNVNSADQAVAMVLQRFRDGADGIKIFAGSLQRYGRVAVMPLDIAKAAVAEAHKSGKPVFSHPQSREGLEVSIQAGVDVLAHTAPFSGPWDPSLTARMKAAHIALVPTLTLWDFEATNDRESAEDKEMWIRKGIEQTKAYADAGGQILFGTDVGYTDHFDTAEEFTLMSRAGMTWQQILASLTTGPAERFGYASRAGRVAAGLDADLVVLQADPAGDVTAFSQVKYTIRAGKVIYKAGN